MLRTPDTLPDSPVNARWFAGCELLNRVDLAREILALISKSWKWECRDEATDSEAIFNSGLRFLPNIQRRSCHFAAGFAAGTGT